MYTIYGIPNCDAVRKAIKWLKEHNIPYTFHDYKKEGIAAEKLEQWSNLAGLEKLLNTKGTTWRGLDADTKSSAANLKGAISLMAQMPSLIKRPVVERNGTLVAVGFNEADFSTAFSR